jgi:hypothetical protein
MKVVRLIAENVKRIKLVNIAPGDASLITIGGKNSAGKSSVLDAVAYAIGGEKLVPSEPIRSGEAEAKIVVDLGELVVTRKFRRDPPPACDCIVSGNTAKPKQHEGDGHAQNCQTLRGWGDTTSTLIVTNKDGARYPSPQAVLDKLLGKLTFDPLAFARAEPKEQDAILRRLVGLNVAPIEARRKAAFDQRAMLKKSHQIKEAQLAALPFIKDAPATEVPMEEISREMLKAEELRKLAEDAEREVSKVQSNGEQLERQRIRLATEVDNLTAQLKDKSDQLARSCKDKAVNEAELLVTQDMAKVQRDAVPDADAIRVKLKNTEVLNAAVRSNQKRDAADVEVKALAVQIAETNVQITQAEQEKIEALMAAAFPVPGLGLSDDGVTFNTLPFAQAGSAEQVRVSVAIGVALNPELKVLLIRNGNMLDKDSLAAVAAQAEAAGMQVWMEWVSGDKDGVSVMMVDGEVVG